MSVLVMSKAEVGGVMGRFTTDTELVAAVRAASAQGHDRLEAFAPFPVPGLAEALGFQPRPIPVYALGAGVLAAAGVLFLQWFSSVIDYPVVVGGKPLASWPAFLPVTFEVGILVAALTAVVMMLAGNRLPRPHHPVFDYPAFGRASDDGFFLMIHTPDPDSARRCLQGLGAEDIEEVGT